MNYTIYDELSREIIQKHDFKMKYEALLKHQHIGTKDEVQLELDDIKILLQIASIFSNSFDEFKQIAYKIASIISLNYSDKYDQLNKIVQYIFISLGQLPVVRKNIEDGYPDYFSIYSDTNIPFNPMQFKSVLLKQIINQIPIELDHQTIYLTDFQRKIYSSLNQGKSISISAPTSSGKSFLLKAFISKKFKEDIQFNVVYIVPTRALISEVTRDFKNSFKHFEVEDINISSAPASYSKDKIIPKKMFVLTQERYHNLLYDVDFEEPIDILIIDEAQKVSEGSRGIILEEVIEESLKRYPDFQVIFISPFAKNPEKFAKMFHLENLQTEKTKLSPVSQNLFLINVNDSSYKLNLSTVEFEHHMQITEGIITDIDKTPFIEADDWKLLWAAKKFGQEFNIVYCNSPRACVKNAQNFKSLLPEIINTKINEAIAFLKENIHEEYFLIDCLKRGVAYHHGKIPNQIRNIIEDLFRDKELKYIFCTSTLLEGVNFPVKNIFIKNPRTGRSSMGRLNFWNLAGRAGRLLKDYYGNIYCVNLEEWRGYKPNPRDVEHEIESILENTFINKNKEIMEYIKNVYFDLKIKNKPIEQAITKFIIQELKIGKTSFIQNFIKRNPNLQEDQFQVISREIEKIAKEIELPAKILQKNSSIDPRKQQKLLTIFEENDPTIPLHPTQNGFLDSLINIYKFINDFFMNKNDFSYKFYAPLTMNWINDKSLNELIGFKLYNLQKRTTPTPEMINNEIEKLFKDINDIIRYDYQKYLKCYIDVLLYYYEKSGYDPHNICENLPMYIEFGSFKKNVLFLQSIGLSRSTSIAINILTKGNFSDETDCLNWLKINKEKIKMKISPIFYREIQEVV